MNETEQQDANAEMIYALVGPTAVGKTELSIELAKAMNAEIVSVDSVQIYQGMDIGSAKPTLLERKGIAHHMIDIISPLREEPFTVAEYQEKASDCIRDIHSRGKQALLVGGTGLYLDSLCKPRTYSEWGGNEEFREEWARKEQNEPGSAHRALTEIDAEAAAKLHPNDKKRVIRALEINTLSGKNLAEHQADDRQEPPLFRSRCAALDMPRAMLYERVDMRVVDMMHAGLRQEVEQLLRTGVKPESRAMQGIGYKECLDWIQGIADEQKTIAKIQQNSRRYAKRQWTWFRRNENVHWFDVTEFATLAEQKESIQEYFTAE